MPALEDLKGKKFNRLTVIVRVKDFESPVNSRKRSRWLCECDCGNLTRVVARYLKRGDIKSCGECEPKRGGLRHDGLKKYWGVNADKMRRRKIRYYTERVGEDELDALLETITFDFSEGKEVIHISSVTIKSYTHYTLVIKETYY